MEDIKSAVKVMKPKPPTEPPPSLGIMTKEEAQYIDDAKTQATKSLLRDVIAKITSLHNISYTPKIKRSTKYKEIYYLNRSHCQAH